MSLIQKLNEVHTKVLQLPSTKNVISQKVVNAYGVCEQATVDIIKASQYLNQCTEETLKERASANVISVGKESAPLIISLRELSDNVLKNDMNDSEIHIEDVIQSGLCKAENNLLRIEDLSKSTNKFIQSLEYVIYNFKNQDKWESILSTVSEISSFLDKDVVTSSPISTSPLNISPVNTLSEADEI